MKIIKKANLKDRLYVVILKSVIIFVSIRLHQHRQWHLEQCA